MAEDKGKLASEQEARDVAEGAREKDWDKPSFTRALFGGKFAIDTLWPPPEPDPSEQARADEWLARVAAFSRDHIDGDAIDRDGWVPDAVLKGLAKGELSAFALTEPDVGSDPANMSTHAVLSSDGKHWILNGEKLWTTNGPRADIIVVMATTPTKDGRRGRKPISAFIVETDWPG